MPVFQFNLPDTTNLGLVEANPAAAQVQQADQALDIVPEARIAVGQVDNLAARQTQGLLDTFAKVSDHLLAPKIKEATQKAYDDGLFSAAQGVAREELEAESPAWLNIFGESASVQGHNAFTALASVERGTSVVLDRMEQYAELDPDTARKQINADILAEVGDVNANPLLKSKVTEALIPLYKSYTKAASQVIQRKTVVAKTNAIVETANSLYRLNQASKKDSTISQTDVADKEVALFSLLTKSPDQTYDSHLATLSNVSEALATSGNTYALNRIVNSDLFKELPEQVRSKISVDQNKANSVGVGQWFNKGGSLAMWAIKQRAMDNPTYKPESLVAEVENLIKSAESETGIPAMEFGGAQYMVDVLQGNSAAIHAKEAERRQAIQDSIKEQNVNAQSMAAQRYIWSSVESGKHPNFTSGTGVTREMVSSAWDFKTRSLVETGQYDQLANLALTASQYSATPIESIQVVASAGARVTDPSSPLLVQSQALFTQFERMDSAVGAGSLVSTYFTPSEIAFYRNYRGELKTTGQPVVALQAAKRVMSSAGLDDKKIKKVTVALEGLQEYANLNEFSKNSLKLYVSRFADSLNSTEVGTTSSRQLSNILNGHVTFSRAGGLFIQENTQTLWAKESPDVPSKELYNDALTMAIYDKSKSIAPNMRADTHNSITYEYTPDLYTWFKNYDVEVTPAFDSKTKKAYYNVFTYDKDSGKISHELLTTDEVKKYMKSPEFIKAKNVTPPKGKVVKTYMGVPIIPSKKEPKPPAKPATLPNDAQGFFSR